MITWENDSSIGDESNIQGSMLPAFEDDNVTSVKMRMKKSNGNIVDVDMLSKFTLEKLDADTLATLLVGKDNISIQEQDGKLVLSCTCSHDGDIYKCQDGDIDIDKVLTSDVCILDNGGAPKYCVYAEPTGAMFLGVANDVLVLRKYDVATGTWTSKALTYITTAEVVSIVARLQENIDINSKYISDVNDKLTVETVERVAGDKASRTIVTAGDNVTVTSSIGSDGQDVYTVSTSGGSSNILVVTYGDAVSLADMQTYDTVLMQTNDKTFYLTEVNDTSAHFMSSYPIASKTQIETCSYDGSTWSEIETVSFGEGTIVLICNQTPTQTFDELITAASSGLLYALRYNVIFPAKFWSGTTIGFYSAIDSRIDGWEYDASKGWSNSTFAIQTKLTAGDGITLDTSGNISATGNGKVASQEGQTPDYLGNVLRAGDNITVTKDGAFVRIDSTGGSSSSGLYKILYSSSNPSRSNTYELSESALNYDYLLVDWVDVDGNARRDRVEISYLTDTSSVPAKVALSSNNFTVFVPDTITAGFGWFKWFRWYLSDSTSTTLCQSGAEYAMSSSGSVKSMSTWSGTSTTVNSPLVHRITGVILKLDVNTETGLNGNIDIDITDSEVI